MSMDDKSLSGNIFSFVNKRCSCKIETTYTAEGTPIQKLRIREIPDDDIHFAYKPEYGLFVTKPKSKNTGKESILSELISIKPRNLDGLIKFFEKYGFFVPLKDGYYKLFDTNDIFNIHKHIIHAVEILAIIQQEKIDYMKLYSKICWLVLSDPVKLKPLDDDDISDDDPSFMYETCIHNFQGQVRSEMDIDCEEYSFTVPDFVRPPSTTIDKTTYLDAVAKNDYLKYPSDQPYRPLLKPGHLMDLFRYKELCPHIDQVMIDYFFHMETEIGQIRSFTKQDDIIFFTQHKKNLDSELKKATITVAKQVIKEEIDYNLSKLSPSYNVNTMSPSWDIPDLITAIFFSIFFIRSEFEVYRKCGNPNCTKYFMVSSTNSRKKYCSPECANSMAQRMHRKRKKEST